VLGTADDEDSNLACFVAQPGVTYLGFIDSETETTARLEIPPGGGVYKCYFGKQNPPGLPNPMGLVTLSDQFGSRSYQVAKLGLGLAAAFCTPAGKNEAVDPRRQDHLNCYSLVPNIPPLPPPFIARQVQIRTENFGLDVVTLRTAADQVCVPARKNTEFQATDDFECYAASSQQQNFSAVTLDDQFNFDENTPRPVQRLTRFCTPTGKNVPAPSVQETDDPATWRHLACYEIPPRLLGISNQINVTVNDQFIQNFLPGGSLFTVEAERRFCEKARKISVTP